MQVRPRLLQVPSGQQVQDWAKPLHLQTEHQQRQDRLDQGGQGLVRGGHPIQQQICQAIQIQVCITQLPLDKKIFLAYSSDMFILRVYLDSLASGTTGKV